MAWVNASISKVRATFRRKHRRGFTSRPAYRKITPPDNPIHRLLVFEKGCPNEGLRFVIPILPDSMREARELLGKDPELERVEKAIGVAIGLEMQKRRRNASPTSGAPISVRLLGAHFVPGVGRSLESLRRA